MNFPGCGNTFNGNHPITEKLIVDALEFWVTEMHVDGFRFDEAVILCRDQNGAPMTNPPVIWQIELSETLADTKIIAEAWDAAGLYEVGYFPGYRWGEWNGRFRDTIRRFVKGDQGYSEGKTSLCEGGRCDCGQRRYLPVQRGGCPSTASISSPRTTASRSTTWSPTTTSTTRPTARAIATASTRT